MRTYTDISLSDTALFLFFIMFSFYSFSQNKIEGYILDKDNLPIKYVNIGFLNKSLGTISDNNGYFSLSIYNIKDTDSLKISHISYKPKVLSVRTIIHLLESENFKFHLSDYFHLLDEVNLIKYNFKKKLFLGYRTFHPRLLISFNSFEQGNEIGRLIRNDKVIWINKLIFHIKKNDFNNVKLRVNLYSVKDDLPFKRLNYEDIFVNTKNKKGKLKFNLSKYKLIIENNFFITLEAVEKEGNENGKFVFKGEWLFNGYFVIRKASHSIWKIKNPHSIAFGVGAKIHNSKK